MKHRPSNLRPIDRPAFDRLFIHHPHLLQICGRICSLKGSRWNVGLVVGLGGIYRGTYVGTW
jgi:hypothetical protein